MTRRQSFVILPLLILLGLVALLLIRFRGEMEPDTIVTVNAPTDASTPLPVHRIPPQESDEALIEERQEVAPPMGDARYVVEGRVVKPDDTPVQGATVELTKNRFHPFQFLTFVDVEDMGSWDLRIPGVRSRTVSAEDGSFRMAVDTPGAYTVFAEKADIGRGVVMSTRVPLERSVRIILRATKGVRGRVYDRATGDGIAGATIAAWIQSAAPGTTRSLGRLRVRSAEDGSFLLPIYDLGVNQYIKTRVRARGFGTPCTSDIVVTDGVMKPQRMDIGMDRARTLHLELVPVQGGSPPVGVKVLISARTQDFAYQYVTDERGEVVVPDFPDTHDARIVLRDPHWALDTTHEPEITRDVAFGGWPFKIPPTGDARAQIPVVPAGRLRGRVVDAETGGPVAGVQVEVGRFPQYTDFSGPKPGPWSAVAVSDEQGRFELDGLWRTRAFVRVRRNNGWCNWPKGWNGERVGQGGFSWEAFRNPVDLASVAERDITVFARRSATLEGRIIDDTGHPVSGASVAEELDRRDMRHVSESALIRDHRAVTDEEGRFSLGGLYPLPEFKLHVRHPDYPDTVAGPFHLKAGGITATGDIVLERSPVVTIVARGPQGPVPGLELLLTPVSAQGRRLSPKTVVTNDQGIASTTGIRETTVDCRFLTLPDGFVPAKLANPFRKKLRLDGSDRIRIPLVEVHRIMGRLVDSDGNPMITEGPFSGKVCFLAHRIDEGADAESPERRAFYVGADGRFRWNVPRGSRWLIEFISREDVDTTGARHKVRYAVKSGSPIEADVPTTVVAGDPFPVANEKGND